MMEQGDKKGRVEILRDEIIYDKGYTRVLVRHFRGKAGEEKEWGMVHVNAGSPVLVIALTDDGKMLLERSFRIPLNAWVYELPGGLNDIEGESDEDVARRELREELGYEVGSVEYLTALADAPGATDTRIRMYLARGARRVAEPALGDDEVIECLLVRPEEIPELLMKGDAECDPKVWAALALLRYRGLL